jgi:branched-chain amino acid transport system substrate-binding protein
MRERKTCLSKFFIMLALTVCLIGGVTQALADDKPKEVLIGGITSLSGVAAPWGIGMENIWQLAVDEINNGGSWWGKKGFTVKGQKYVWKLKTYDHAFNAAKAVSAANRLINRDNAKFIFAFDGGMIKAFQPISEKKKVITIAYASPGKDYINSKTPYTWMYGIDCMAAVIFYPWLEKNTNTKRIAILEPDHWTGHTTAKASRFGIAKTKMEVVFDEYFPPDMTDFYPVLTRLLETKPDLIDVGNVDPAARGLILKQARELGFTGPMYVITPDIPNLRDVAGWDKCEGLYFVPYDTELTPGQKHLKENYIKRFGEDNWIGAISYIFYDYAFWLTQAIEETGSFDTTVLVNHMETMKIKSIYGEPAYFAGKGYYGINRIPLYPYNISQVQNGKLVQVISGAYATYLE